jgi:hypothetical protein
MTRRLLLLLLLAGATAAPALAQRRGATLAAAAPRVETAATAELAAPTLGERTARAASSRRSVLTLLGGAVIGAGAGYLTSQVAWSDWDKHNNSEFKSRRLNFTLGGGALGALTGLVVGHQVGRGGQVAPAGTVRAPEPRRGTLLAEEEVRASTATNVYELLQALRPQWLRVRGDNAHAEVNVETAGIRVYVERGYVGDVNALRQIATAEVTTVEFLDAATATYRLGQGNPLGAIVVHTGRMRP